MSLEEVAVECPYCGETFELEVEALSESQTFIEDCRVCCRPIQFRADPSEEGLEVTATRSQ